MVDGRVAVIDWARARDGGRFRWRAPDRMVARLGSKWRVGAGHTKRGLIRGRAPDHFVSRCKHVIRGGEGGIQAGDFLQACQIHRRSLSEAPTHRPRGAFGSKKFPPTWKAASLTKTRSTESASSGFIWCSREPWRRKSSGPASRAPAGSL